MDTPSTSRPATCRARAISSPARWLFPAPSTPSTATTARSPGRTASISPSRSTSTSWRMGRKPTAGIPSADGDDRATGVAGGGFAGFHLLGDTHRLLDERLDDLRLRHRLD